MADKLRETFFDHCFGNFKHHAVGRVKQTGDDVVIRIEIAQQCLVERDLREMRRMDGING